MSQKLRVLLVEDKDNPHVVSALFNKHGVLVTVKDGWRDRGVTLELKAVGLAAVEVQVKVVDGKDDLLARLPVECKASDLERLAIIIDADANFCNRWDQLKDGLEKGGCKNIPQHTPEGGLVLRIPDGPLVGVWIMPDNSQPGMLEDFALSLVPPDDPILPLVKEFINSIPEAIRPFPICHLSKAIIHTWLALREEPGKPLGKAITATELNPQTSECVSFVQWLRTILLDQAPLP